MSIKLIAVRKQATNRNPRNVAYTTDRSSLSSTEPGLDPRVRRTRRLLQEALLGASHENGFDDITVQDITDRAGLNRATFYLHYRDKDDLLTQIMKDALDALVAQVAQVGERRTSAESAQEVIAGWFKHAAAYPELYHLVLGRNDRASFSIQVRTHIEQLMTHKETERNRDRRSGVPAAMRLRFQSSACLAVIGWWLEQRMPHPPEEMATWLRHLLESVDSSD